MTAAWRPRIGNVYRESNSRSRSSRFTRNSCRVAQNWAVRTEVQRRYRFDSRLGRLAKQRRGGEEERVIRQLLADGPRRPIHPRGACAAFYTRRESESGVYTKSLLRPWADRRGARGPSGAGTDRQNLPLCKSLVLVERGMCRRRLPIDAAFCQTAGWIGYATHLRVYWGVLSPPSPEYDANVASEKLCSRSP